MNERELLKRLVEAERDLETGVIDRAYFADVAGLLSDQARALLAQPERKPLTNEQIEAISNAIERSDFFECVVPFARAIERAHGIE